MNKIGVMFSGQGAQKVGMGKSLFDNVDVAKEVFLQAKEIMPNILDVCFEGTSDMLNLTINTQPAMFTVDMAAFAAFNSYGFNISCGAGFSLGEYPALCASGMLSFKDALTLVIKRAKWMQEEAEKNSGGMVAILGKTAKEAEELTQKFENDGMILPVNYNCPGQTVVAGESRVIDKLIPYCKENKIKCAKLPVNGAFHSPQMKEVGVKIADYIKNIEFGAPTFTLYANKTGLPYKEDVKETLALQASSPVQFESIINNMLKSGVTTFVEVGFGGTLCGFVKRISKEVTVLNVQDADTLKETTEQLKGLI